MSTILIVDDEYLILEILGDMLEDAKYSVEKAGDGMAALEVLERMRIELIITDYMMPRLNGEELALAVRDDPVYREVPIILISGAQAGIARQRPDLFQAVLNKPFTPDQLIEEVRKLVPPSTP